MPSDDIGWYAEAGGIGLRQRRLDTVQLGPPNKLGVIVVMTREQSEHSSGEAIFAMLMKEDIAASLDAAMFSDAEAAPPVPQGLLFDVTPITAPIAAGPGIRSIEPALIDLQNLAGEIVANGGDGNKIIFIASPRQAVAANLWLANRNITIWPSAALTDGTVLAIQSDCFCSMFGDAKVSLTKDAPLIMHSDGSAFSDGAPAASTFQQDLVAIKIVIDCAWCMRAEGRISVVEDVTWGVAPTP